MYLSMGGWTGIPSLEALKNYGAYIALLLKRAKTALKNRQNNRNCRTMRQVVINAGYFKPLDPQNEFKQLN